MKKIFEVDSKCLFMKAPVKTYHRCLIKSNTDYSDREYSIYEGSHSSVIPNDF